ncbi:glycosyltransferase [Parasulfitobacter algicola]|uniref:Glycosyltransferase n=1 Tax=Parasulfitobacter algicola TaxID=2614809 RepID=A0ABX2IVT8_9RHOB|nr:glycosyltransferase [Sulfitobacter algicola]NSX57042.1 glycosyltransferase [Sulfitobacter algicola]
MIKFKGSDGHMGFFRRQLIRLRDVFRLYAEPRLRAFGPGRPLIDKDTKPLGHVDYVEMLNGVYHVVGWSFAQTIWLSNGTETVHAVRRIARTDVGMTENGDGLAVGFEVCVPRTSGIVFLGLETGDESGPQTCYHYEMPQIAHRAIGLSKARVALSFSAVLLKAFPSFVSWAFSRTPDARARLVRNLQLTLPERTYVCDPRALAADPAHILANAHSKMTIILPVYNAYDLVTQALDRVERHTDVDWHLILIEDCSSDDRIRPYLRDWANDPSRAARIDLLENDRNLGFISSVNRAFAQALERGDHVILLNSDALVPQRWATRLLSPILADPGIATVTPMSNDAEILSVPMICRRRDLAPGQADAIDLDAQRLNVRLTAATLPTGVGFCMAMNIHFLRQIGLFDDAFGKGYGEEVDWCQRARASQGRHVGLGALFVEHRGGTSFGSDAKKKLVQQNNQKIARRYPGYDAQVQSFIRSDPLNTARLVLGISLANQVHMSDDHGPIPIYLAHSMGGGAEFYLQSRLKDDLAKGGFAVVLRVGHAQARWYLELHSASGTVAAAVSDFDTVLRLVAPLGKRRIIYSCGVGHHDGADLPDRLLRLRGAPGDSIEVLFHDYFPISPSYTLLGRDGRYHGVPQIDTDDIAHSAETSGGQQVSLAAWRAEWQHLLEAALSITVFSQDSKAIVLAVWPHLAPKITVRPHALHHKVDKITPRPQPSDRPVIGVLGNIGHHKGGKILQDLGHMIDKTNSPHSIVVIGKVAPDYTMPATIQVHGAYDIRDLPDLVCRYKISRWLIPSIWPETFSYTTHEALATGMPVYCFDLGAQAEAVRQAPNGHVLSAAFDDLAALLSDLHEPERDLCNAG